MYDRSRHVSESYLLAESVRPALEARAQTLRQELNTAGCDRAVRPFMTMISEQVQAGINMSIPDCIRLIKHGAWLTIYEAVNEETSYTGDALEQEVQARLTTRGTDWYECRKKIEQMLKFSHDTHYAALNVGGVGAQRYGDCCVLINWSKWRAVSTCFGGDTLRSTFASDGTDVVDTQEVLKSFAIGQDLDKVALLSYEHSLRTYATPKAGPLRRPPAFDEQEMRTAIESSDFLVELHLHGRVTIDQVRGVVITKSRQTELWNQYLAWEGANKPMTHAFEAARYFVELSDLLEEHHITLKTVGGS